MTTLNLDGAQTTTSGTLHDYRTGEAIRPATPAERLASLRAAEKDGGVGAFLAVVDDREITCYVD